MEMVLTLTMATVAACTVIVADSHVIPAATVQVITTTRQPVSLNNRAANDRQASRAPHGLHTNPTLTTAGTSATPVTASSLSQRPAATTATHTTSRCVSTAAHRHSRKCHTPGHPSRRQQYRHRPPPAPHRMASSTRRCRLDRVRHRLLTPDRRRRRRWCGRSPPSREPSRGGPPHRRTARTVAACRVWRVLEGVLEGVCGRCKRRRWRPTTRVWAAPRGMRC